MPAAAGVSASPSSSLEAARALGRSFGQNAILSGEGTGPPSIVPCFPGA